MYETLDNIGDICLALFVSMSIVTMKLWQLIDLALPLNTILMIQLVIIYLFTRFITFNLCGHDYDAAIIAVGHKHVEWFLILILHRIYHDTSHILHLRDFARVVVSRPYHIHSMLFE